MRLDPGRHLGRLLRQAALEEVGRLDDVVVDAHQDQIVDLHCGPPGGDVTATVRLGQMDGTSIVRRPPFGSNPLVGERGSDTQRKILGAALEVFADVGFNEARVELITKRAGCSRPAFYQYFSSKDDVFWQLAGQLGHEMVQLGHRLDPVTPDADGHRRARALDRRVHGPLRRLRAGVLRVPGRQPRPRADGRRARAASATASAPTSCGPSRSRAGAAATSRSPRRRGRADPVQLLLAHASRAPSTTTASSPGWPSSSTGSSPDRSRA